MRPQLDYKAYMETGSMKSRVETQVVISLRMRYSLGLKKSELIPVSVIVKKGK